MQVSAFQIDESVGRNPCTERAGAANSPRPFCIGRRASLVVSGCSLECAGSPGAASCRDRALVLALAFRSRVVVGLLGDVPATDHLPDVAADLGVSQPPLRRPSGGLMCCRLLHWSRRRLTPVLKLTTESRSVRVNAIVARACVKLEQRLYGRGKGRYRLRVPEPPAPGVCSGHHKCRIFLRAITFERRKRQLQRGLATHPGPVR